MQTWPAHQVLTVTDNRADSPTQTTCPSAGDCVHGKGNAWKSQAVFVKHIGIQYPHLYIPSTATGAQEARMQGHI